MARATTIRFTDEMHARLDRAASWTGMPVNSIVVAACLEWMQRHTADPSASVPTVVTAGWGSAHAPPRWATLRRAVKLASGGKQPFYPFERFTTTAQRMLTAAQAEADRGGHDYIATEHLLLAAYAVPASHAAMVLASLDVDEEDVRTKLAQVLAPGKRTVTPKIVPTTRVKQVIELAFKMCAAASEPRVSTGHVLLALAAEGEGVAARVLEDLGASVERIESALESFGEPEP